MGVTMATGVVAMATGMATWGEVVALCTDS